MDVRAELDNVLANSHHIVIVGIGNELNGDDGFGIYLSEKLQANLSSAADETGGARKAGTKVFVAHTAPENFVGSIVNERPSHVIFLDVAHFSGEPGQIRLLTAEDLANMETATHRIPLPRIIERILSFHECHIVIVGVQPGSMEVGGGLTPEIKAAADELYRFLARTIE